LTELKRIQLSNTFFPDDTIGYAKGGSADLVSDSPTVADFHVLAYAGQMVVNATTVTFCFVVNWISTEPDSTERCVYTGVWRGGEGVFGGDQAAVDGVRVGGVGMGLSMGLWPAGRGRRADGMAGMRGSLDRRLTALERAPGAGGVELRVFSTDAEADADAKPSGPRVEVLRIVTGVPRPADAA
jgi:hypothetical protein